MIDINEVLELHKMLIEKYGGANGVRDLGLLEAAINAPFMGFGDYEFYPTPEQKAAVVLHRIIQNHPFIDGNKRTGYSLMRIILRNNKLDIQATPKDKYDFVINVASGKMSDNEIVLWIYNRVIPLM